MLIEEIITEIRAEPYPYTVKHKDGVRSSSIEATFETRDGSEIEVLIVRLPDNQVEILFSRNGQIKAPGTGDQFRILFTIQEIIRQHLNTIAEHADQVLFTADSAEPSRVRLYTNRVVPLVSQILGSGWSKPKIEPGAEVQYIWDRTNRVTEGQLNEIRIEPYPIQTHFDAGHSEGPALVGEFKTNNGDPVSCYIFYKESDHSIYINFKRAGATHATGTGDQFKIFGTALEFFKTNLAKMIKRFKPAHMVFRVNNAEANRVALYRRRLVPEINKILPGNWTGPVERARQDGSISGTYFIWDNGNIQESRYLSEIRAEPYPYEVINRSTSESTTIIASFKARDDSMVKVIISGIKGAEAEISFTRNGRVKASGTGDQFRILITVQDVIQKYLNKVADEATELLFTADADEPSRVKLYTNRVVPLVSRLLGSGWAKPQIHHADEVVYVWKRLERTNDN